MYAFGGLNVAVIGRHRRRLVRDSVSVLFGRNTREIQPSEGFRDLKTELVTQRENEKHNDGLWMIGHESGQELEQGERTRSGGKKKRLMDEG